MRFEDDPEGRDARGRWQKGHCPNPRGRPRKKPPISDADVNHFMNTTVTAMINGEQRRLTRQELLMHKMYEAALKGSILIQRKLFERFEQSDETYASANMIFLDISKRLLAGYHRTGKLDEALFEEYREMAALLNKDIDRPVRGPRKPRKSKSTRPNPWANFRKGPKPQALLDLEKKEAEEEAAWQARWAARRRYQQECEAAQRAKESKASDEPDESDDT